MKKQKTVTVVTVAEAVPTVETAKLGRPVNPNSVRQQKITERENKRAAGELKRGRPVVAESKRQQTLAAREAKRASGAPVKRGRPIVEGSKRQQTLKAKTTVSVEEALANIMA